jgi:hypothetical protein
MAQWHEVQEHARQTFQLDRDEPHEFALTIPRLADQPREQRIMVRHYSAWGREMIEFRSAFGELGDLDPVALLKESLHLPLGGLALHGRFLVVVHRECLEPLSVETALWLLLQVSLVADELEERRGTDRF